MVKPALSYLDVIARVAEASPVPVKLTTTAPTLNRLPRSGSGFSDCHRCPR